MAKKKTVRKQTPREIDRRLKALEIGLKDLDKVRANLRKYLDDVEECLGGFPRLIGGPRAKTRGR